MHSAQWRAPHSATALLWLRQRQKGLVDTVQLRPGWNCGHVFTGWEAGQGRAEINAGEREMRETKSEGEHEVCRLRDWQSALICPPQGSSCCCCCLTVCLTILSEYPTGQRVQRAVYCTWYDLFYVITTFIWNSAVLSFQYFCCPVCQLLFPAAGCCFNIWSWNVSSVSNQGSIRKHELEHHSRC